MVLTAVTAALQQPAQPCCSARMTLLEAVSQQDQGLEHARAARSSIVKLREREGQVVDPGRSLKGHLWMVDGGWWYTFPYGE